MVIYSDFQSYKVHLSPLPSSDEGVGGRVLVPGLIANCCNNKKISKSLPGKNFINPKIQI
jgi:hypothetical protein